MFKFFFINILSATHGGFASVGYITPLLRFLICLNSVLSAYCHDYVTTLSGLGHYFIIVHSIYNVLMTENSKTYACLKS